jgi:hypothetical protein
LEAPAGFTVKALEVPVTVTVPVVWLAVSAVFWLSNNVMPEAVPTPALNVTDVADVG